MSKLLQIIDRQETLINQVDMSDEILNSPINDSEPDHVNLPNDDSFDESVPNSVGGSPSINLDVDLEGGQHPPQSPPHQRSINPSVRLILYIYIQLKL